MKLISLEKEFVKACNRHPHLRLLESQWRFDKELISKALQNISSIFPHYSRHDASHSKQIIVNIERLLGERIRHLTATDMWLILEAAYTHDIGMIVTHKQIQDLDTPEFSSFINEIILQPEHSLNKFAIDWAAGKAELPTGAGSHIFLNKYIQLIAEWYRKKHPENSAKIIRNPYGEIGLDSPRNELLPNRLFNCLASICHSHGESFEKTLELPFSEAGMATEDCHPRYVAFLLRMGDLLDVDDNRFCPVMMRMSGSNLPTESHAHYEKHRSIRHFRLDSERIEIDVVCPSPESYEQAYQWFKWLESEYYKQSQHWHNIVPSKKLGRLPTLSTPNVSIEKPFITIENGKKPQFKVDETALLKLLRSTGLYSKKSESIREILQNAVDSTLFEIWSKHKETISKLNPTHNELIEIYEQHRINVDFKQDEDNRNTFWLSITDQGTGISEDDLKFMLQVGSSRKNRRRSLIRQEMPMWFRPSGNFGIGLQSIYLLSDTFSITTKSRVTHKALEIKLSSKEDQSVVIKTLNPESVNYGATVLVKIEINGFPETITFGANNDLLRTLVEYDFTRPDSDLKGYEQIAILSAIDEFNIGSPIKLSSNNIKLTNHNPTAFFSPKANVVLSQIRFGHGYGSNFKLLFRGQEFSGLTPSLELISCVVDYYGHQALDFLSYNREKILPQAKRAAITELTAGLLEYIEKKIDSMDVTEKPFAAAIYFLYGPDENNNITDHLLKFPLHIYNKESRELGDVLSDIKNKKIRRIEVKENSRLNLDDKDYEPSTDEDTLVLERISANATVNLIKHLATKDGMFWQEQLNQTDHYRNRHIVWDDNDIQPVEDKILFDILAGNSSYLEVGNRMFFPAWGKYRKLASNANVPWARIHKHFGANTEYLVLPCKFGFNEQAEIEIDDTFLSWTYTNRSDDNLDFDEHKKIYQELAEHLRKIIENPISN